MHKGLWGLCVCVAVAGCATTQAKTDPTTSSFADVEAAVGAGRVFAAYQGDSTFTVALIPEFHHLGMCQLDVYDTLQALRPMTAFVAVEGRIGDVEHEDLAATFAGLFTDDQPARDESSLADRQKRVATWRRSGELPREPGQNIPLSAAVLHEAVFQDDVVSKGLESPDVFARAHRIAANYQRMNAVGLMPKTTIIGARNRIFVRKLDYYGTVMREDGKDVVPFPVGAAHVENLGRKLRRHKISYVVLFNQSCFPPQLTRIR